MTAVELLRDIRDLLAHRGRDSEPGMPTTRRGVETPLLMAHIRQDVRSMVGKGPDFSPYAQEQVHHYVAGELVIVVNSAKPAAVFTYHADVRVIGWIGNVSIILALAAVNSGSGPLFVPWGGDGTAFDRVTIDARQVVDGVPTAGSPGPDAKLDMQLEGRLYR